MPTWGWILLGVGATLFLLFGLMIWLVTRRSAAGIHTSRWGRTIRLGFGATRMWFRYVGRWIRRLFMSKARREELDQRFHEETAQHALETMGNMKGALMKLGQIVSFMDEMLPAPYQDQLRKLQTQAPPMDYDTVVREIREELGNDPEKLFTRFDKKPLASASIGQVHRARLHDGTDVVVKIQYPGVDDAISADLQNAGMLMMLIGAVTPTLDAGPIAKELRERLLEELDYEQEARNQELFRGLFEDHPDMVIPRVFPEVSSRRILTSEYIEGIGFYDFVESASPEARRRAVLTIRTFVFDSMFYHHVFNGDPHPGNYLFLEDGRVAFLDFGCVKRFDHKFISDFLELNRYYLLGQRDAYFDKACDMGFIKRGHEHKVARDWLWEYARWFYLPILADQPFQFSPEYCRQAVAQIFGENMRLLNMPAEYLMLNRITFGLNSILSRMRAREDWRALSMDYYFPEGYPEEAMAAIADHAAAAMASSSS